MFFISLKGVVLSASPCSMLDGFCSKMTQGAEQIIRICKNVVRITTIAISLFQMLFSINASIPVR